MIEWRCKLFRDLSVYDLYAILRLRNEVFVVKQNCIFQDADNKDQLCYHLCGWERDLPVAYCRLMPPGIAFNEISIGRVVSSPAYRRRGIGFTLMQKAIEYSNLIFGKQEIRIGAQLYLKDFYQSLGFVQCSDVYLEDNIKHIQMLFVNFE